MIKNYYNLKTAQFTMERDLVEDTTLKIMKELENDFTLTIGEDLEVDKHLENNNQVFFMLAENGHEEFYQFQEKFLTYQDAIKAMNKIPIYTDVKNHSAWIDVKNDPRFAKIENH